MADAVPVLLSALKTVDELVQKLEFEGPSISITSRHLSVGVSAFSSASFNGTSFSASLVPNTSEPQVAAGFPPLSGAGELGPGPPEPLLPPLQIHFEDQTDPLAQVTLPASLLSGLAQTEAELSSMSRINFMFFSSTSLFQVGPHGTRSGSSPRPPDTDLSAVPSVSRLDER